MQVRNHLAGSSEHAPLHARIAAALMTSAVGILAANPSDVVKVRMQVSFSVHVSRLIPAWRSSLTATRGCHERKMPIDEMCHLQAIQNLLPIPVFLSLLALQCRRHSVGRCTGQSIFECAAWAEMIVLTRGSRGASADAQASAVYARSCWEVARYPGCKACMRSTPRGCRLAGSQELHQVAPHSAGQNTSEVQPEVL